MIKCIAIDDEPLALQQLTNYLEKVPFFEIAGSCLSASEAMKILSEEPVDAIFLDINMPDLNGLEFVQSLVHQPLIVFTTAYSEYALEGYKTNAVDYLLKPYGMADIQRAANKIKERYDLQQAAELAQKATPSSQGSDTPADDADFMFLKTDYRVVRVGIADIEYVKGMGGIPAHLHQKPNEAHHRVAEYEADGGTPDQPPLYARPPLVYHQPHLHSRNEPLWHRAQQRGGNSRGRHLPHCHRRIYRPTLAGEMTKRTGPSFSIRLHILLYI